MLLNQIATGSWFELNGITYLSCGHDNYDTIRVLEFNKNGECISVCLLKEKTIVRFTGNHIDLNTIKA